MWPLIFKSTAQKTAQKTENLFHKHVLEFDYATMGYCIQVVKIVVPYCTVLSEVKTLRRVKNKCVSLGFN